MGFVSVLAAIAVGPALLAATAAARAGVEEQMDLLLDAIAKVESHNNPASIGDSGRAAGMYQIHRYYWADATRILGVDWGYQDARDPEKARQVVRAYLRHYGSGRTLLDMARIHNGGPRGHEKAATLTYARRVEQVLNGAV
jgi:predicted component of type VI protein secretion system